MPQAPGGAMAALRLGSILPASVRIHQADRQRPPWPTGLTSRVASAGVHDVWCGRVPRSKESSTSEDGESRVTKGTYIIRRCAPDGGGGARG